MNPSIFRTDKLVLIVFVFLAAIYWTLFSDSAVSAKVVSNTNVKDWSLTNVSPAPNRMFAINRLKHKTGSAEKSGVETNAMEHLLKNMSESDVKRLDLAAYFKNPSQNANDRKRSFQIVGNFCSVDKKWKDKGYMVYVTMWVGNGFGDKRREFFINYDKLCGKKSGYNSTDDLDVSKNRFYAKYAIGGLLSGSTNIAAAEDERSGGMYKVNFSILMTKGGSNKRQEQNNNTITNPNADGLRNQFRFRVRVSGANTKIGSIEPATGDDTKYNFGLVARKNDPGTGVNFALPFGVECDFPDGGNLRPIIIHDPDNHVFGSIRLKVFKKNQSNKVSALKNSEYDISYGTNNSNVSFVTGGASGGSRDGVVINKNSSGGFVKVGIKNPSSKFRYLVQVHNPSNGQNRSNVPAASPDFPYAKFVRASQNVFSIGVPKEALFGDASCKLPVPDPVPPASDVNVSPNTYSYFSKLTGKAKVEATRITDHKPNGAELKRKYKWRVYELKYKSHLPTGSIGTIEMSGNGCDEIIAKYGSGHSNFTGYCERVAYGGDVNDNLNDGTPSKKHDFAGVLNSGPDPVGTYTCYVAAVENRPSWRSGIVSAWDNYYSNQLEDDPDYVIPSPAYPNPQPDEAYKFNDFDENSCSLSGINPKFQVRGHDVKTSGNIITPNQAIFGRRDGVSVGSENDFAYNYGSWGEYYVSAEGLISTPRGVDGSVLRPSMASGIGRAKGGFYSQSAWSSMTISNNNDPEYGNYGGYIDSEIPSGTSVVTAQDIKDGSVLLSGVAYDDAKNAIRMSSLAFVGNGSRHTFDFTESSSGSLPGYTGTVVITENLSYGNSSYSNIRDIPRVVVLADNIEVKDSVTRIDPWLVAYGTLNTCYLNPTAHPTDYITVDTARDDAQLTVGRCRSKLQFNGPVYAGSIMLMRTGGSRYPAIDSGGYVFDDPNDPVNDPTIYCVEGNCSDGEDGRELLSTPGELFSLNPGVFLSSYSGGGLNTAVVETDTITELPPKF